MGLMKSKTTNNTLLNGEQSSLLSSCGSFRSKDKRLNKRRLCSKKKVLMLGLDRSGKTDLFHRLISCDQPSLKIDAFPQPTMGYNVETIGVRCYHLNHHQYHKITLWDCGGHASVRSLWPYHYSNTSLLLWIINIHDRKRLDMNLQLLSQVLNNSLLYQVPVLIVLYHSSFHQFEVNSSADEENLLTNLEVAFRFLATLSTSRASSFKWQVINVTVNEKDCQTDLKKIRECFRELMEL
ncbi:unnamed protein product [Adineta ricciae]|uniref:Uncharacterized protein n=1 Tax=Adineta ricciae TaxID=249248 RepID=A0A816ER67_ADIRI|nr:unnamed protein product [Adineta ricciae]CAF1651441.1 unnamed protein product [Adineta ricciae]